MSTFYRKLKIQSEIDCNAKNTLNALHDTLKHFQVKKDNKQIAELVLKFHLLSFMDASILENEDQKIKALKKIVKYFNNSLIKKG